MWREQSVVNKKSKEKYKTGEEQTRTSTKEV